MSVAIDTEAESKAQYDEEFDTPTYGDDSEAYEHDVCHCSITTYP